MNPTTGCQRMITDAHPDAPHNLRDSPTACDVILTIAIVASALLFSFRLTSFLHAKDLALSIALLCIAIAAVAQNRSPWDGARMFAPLWALLAYATVVHAGLGAAQVPTYTLEATTRYATLLLLAGYAYNLTLQGPRPRHALHLSILASATGVAALGLLQYAGLTGQLFPVLPEYAQRAYSVFGNQDLFGGYVALAIPLAVSLFFAESPRPRWMIGIAMLMVAALLISGSRSAWLAASIGTLVAYPRRKSSPRSLRGLALVVLITTIAVVALAPGPTLNRLKSSFSSSDVGFQARMWFWDASLRMLRDNPVLGVGPGNFAYWSPSYQGEALHAPDGRDHYHNDLHTLHAHNDALELATETGLIGLALAGWMLWSLRTKRGAEWGALAAYFTFGLFNTTLHSGPHLLVALLLMGALLGRSESAPPTAPNRSTFARAGIPIALLLLGCTLWMTILPSYRLSAARDAYDTESDETNALYEEAVAYAWPQYEAAEDWGILLLEAQRFDELESSIDQARKGRDTWTLHYLSGRALEHTGNTPAALKAYQECLRRWPGYIPAWRASLALTPDPDKRQTLLEEARLWLDDEQAEQLREYAK